MLTPGVTAAISLASLCLSLQTHFSSGCLLIYVLALTKSGHSPAKTVLHAQSSLSRTVRATQDGLPHKGSQTFQRTISKHRVFFSLFLLSTQWLKTKNGSLLFIWSLLTKSKKKKQHIIFSGSFYKYCKTISLLHEGFCCLSFVTVKIEFSLTFKNY